MDQNMMEVALDKLEKKGINRYKAVLMAAQEARFINDQVRARHREKRRQAHDRCFKAPV